NTNPEQAETEGPEQDSSRENRSKSKAKRKQSTMKSYRWLTVMEEFINPDVKKSPTPGQTEGMIH
ncbi:hypothetical protein P7K49_004548, partial [Saguinus oedipus]